MPRIDTTLQRTQPLTIKLDGKGEGDAVFEIAGLNAAVHADLNNLLRKNRLGDAYRFALRHGVKRIVSGIVDAKDRVLVAGDVDLCDLLTLDEADKLFAAILELSRLGAAAKKR